MSKHRADITHANPVPADWFNTLMEYVGTLASNFVISLATSTSIQVVAGTGSSQVALGVNGKFRYITATANVSHPGGAAGPYDIYAVASENVFGAGVPETDTTDYAFGLAIVAGGAAAPTGSFNSRAIAHTRKVGTLTWDGAAITGISQSVGTITPHVFDPTIWLGASSMWPTLTGGASPNTEITVGAAAVYVLDFADAATQAAQINFPLPWDFPAGGKLQARFIWESGSAGGGDVRWGVEGASVGDNDSLGIAFGTTVYVVDTNNGADKTNVSGWSGDITLSSTPAPGEICFLRVLRDGSNAADTHTATARLIGVQLKYTRAT